MSDLQGIVIFNTVFGGTAFSLVYTDTINGGKAGTEDINYEYENLDGGNANSTY